MLSNNVFTKVHEEKEKLSNKVKGIKNDMNKLKKVFYNIFSY